MSKNAGVGMELLFVRHDNERLRAQVSQLRDLLRRPFEDFGSTWLGSSDESTSLLPQPLSERSNLLVGRFPKQAWFSVSSNAASVGKILKANAQVGQLQFARLQFDGAGKLAVLEVWKGGKAVCRYEAGTDPSDAVVTGNSQLKKSVASCATPGAAIKILRDYFQLRTGLKTVVQADKYYCVIDEKGRESSPTICALLILEGKKFPKALSPIAATLKASAKDSPIKVARPVDLAAALMRFDANEVRAAIEQGANLEKLSGSKLTPLHYAITRFESPGARECATLLIEGGAKIGELIAECCTNLYTPQYSFDRVQFLIAQGGDVNALSESGAPAIYCAARLGYIAVVRLLMEHGANPHASVPRLNASTVEWARDQLERATSPDQKQLYADLLTDLTGTKVAVPEERPLGEALVAENLRFAQALRGQELLSLLPAEVKLQDSDENKLGNNSAFKRLHEELLAEGFQQNGLLFEASALPVFIVTYTNERRQFDAILSDRWWLEEVGCRIFAHGSDGELFSVGNVSGEVAPIFQPEFLILGEHLKCRPRKLVLELSKLVQQNKAKLLPTPPAKFTLRYQSVNDRMLVGIKQRVEEVLERDAIRDDSGRPLRFERRRNYLNFASFRDQDYSSGHRAELILKDIESTRSTEDSSQLSSVVRGCFELLAMQHLQYAGVSRDRSFLWKGCDAGIKLFQKLKTKRKGDVAVGLVEELGMAMLLCRISGDDSRLRKLCDSVQTEMMTDSLLASDDSPLELGQALLAIVSHFRTKPIPQIADIKQQVARSRSKRAKALLNTCDSLKRSDRNSLTTHLCQSLKLFAAQTDPNPNPNYLFSKFAVPESILFDAGRELSLVDNVPVELADWMITK